MNDTTDSYSGQDETGEVWRLVNGVIDLLDSGELSEQHAEMCQRAYDLERDTNWKSLALGLKGMVHHRLGNEPEATKDLQRAVDLAAPYAENFDDVVNVYCQTCYTLESMLFDHEDRTQEALLVFLRCLPYMNDVYADLFIGNIFGFLDTLYSRLGREEESAVFAESALYFCGLDNSALESLMYSYANLEDLQRARAVHNVLREKVTDREMLARISRYQVRGSWEVFF